jgi:hypothetical protein
MKTFKHFDEQVQTRSCQQLLASVVAAAVNDTCVEPFKVTTKDKTTLMRIDTVTAFRFLFDDSVSGVDAYALWLDFNVQLFRRKLLEMMYDDSQRVVNGKNPELRRNFRYNYKLWLKLPKSVETQELEQPDEGDEDDRLGRRTVEIKFTR